MSKLICRVKQKNGQTIVSLNGGNTVYISKPKVITNVSNPLNSDGRYFGKNGIQFSEQRRQHLKNKWLLKQTFTQIFHR
jgi:hypothetical protein